MSVGSRDLARAAATLRDPVTNDAGAFLSLCEEHFKFGHAPSVFEFKVHVPSTSRALARMDLHWPGHVASNFRVRGDTV